MIELENGFRIQNALLCEDIREEKTNKFILIGVFSGDILIAQLPAAIPVSIFVDGRIEKMGEDQIWVRFSGPGKHEGTMQISYARVNENDDKITLPLPRVELGIESEGIFKVEVSVDQSNWHMLFEKTVTVSDQIYRPGRA